MSIYRMSQSQNSQSKWQSFMHLFYNPEEKSFLGRTGSSWGKILIFYFVYYSLLAAFFGGMLTVFMYGIVVKDKPHLQGQNSLLREGPGIGIDPLFKDKKSKTVESTLIHVTYNASDDFFEQYKNETEELLKSYREVNESTSIPCPLSPTKTTPSNGTVCKFNLTDLGPCEDPSGHFNKTKEICIFLKLNKIYGWIPDVKENASDPMVECYGQNPADVENMGEVKYMPQAEWNGKKYGAFSHAFFPFYLQPGYLPPLVAMRLPTMKTNTVILIKCHVTGVNDVESGESAFELLVDDN